MCMGAGTLGITVSGRVASSSPGTLILLTSDKPLQNFFIPLYKMFKDEQVGASPLVGKFLEGRALELRAPG